MGTVFGCHEISATRLTTSCLYSKRSRRGRRSDDTMRRPNLARNRPGEVAHGSFRQVDAVHPLSLEGTAVPEPGILLLTDASLANETKSALAFSGWHARVFASMECRRGHAGRGYPADRVSPGLSMLTLRRAWHRTHPIAGAILFGSREVESAHRLVDSADLSKTLGFLAAVLGPPGSPGVSSRSGGTGIENRRMVLEISRDTENRRSSAR